MEWNAIKISHFVLSKIKGQPIMLRKDANRNNKSVIYWVVIPVLCEKTGPIYPALVGLMAGQESV